MRRLSGVVPFYRADLARLKDIRPAALRLYLAYVCFTGWDPNYHISFGVVKVSDKDISSFFKYSASVASISHSKKELEACGLIKTVNGKVVVVDFIERYKDVLVAMKRCKEGNEVWNIESQVQYSEQGVQPVESTVQPVELAQPDVTADTSNSQSKALVSFSGEVFSDDVDTTNARYDEHGFDTASLEAECFCGSGMLLKNCCFTAVKAAFETKANPIHERTRV